MSLKLSSQSPNMPFIEYTANASTGYTLGKLALRNTSTGEINEGTTTVINIECVIAETVTTNSSDPLIKATPIISGPGQLWIVDCTASTNVNQLNKVHNMTSATHVDNTDTTDGSTAGVFVALKIVGASGDKKLLGYFVKIGQVVT